MKEMETETQERYRLAVLGSGKVGKTSIIRRYLNNTFSERYRETVEDIFSRTFYIQGAELPLDVYDTNFYYPDMRKLTLSSANAFLIVYASDNVASFKDVSFNERKASSAFSENQRIFSDLFAPNQF